MTIEELKVLNEDDESQERFVNDLPHVQSLKQTVTDMINGTEELESNYSHYSNITVISCT